LGFYFAQFLTGLASASSLFLVAAGLSIIFGVTRIVNLAHGSFFMLGAYIAYTIVTKLSVGPLGFWLAVLVAAVAVGLIGVAVEMLLLRRIYHAPEMFQLLATFGVVLVVQDAALAIWGPADKLGPRAPGLDGAVRIFGELVPEYDLAMIVLGPAVLGAIWLLFHKTRWGTLVRAATQDREMVGALGANQKVLFTSVFFVGAMLAGLGGAAQVPREAVSLFMDLNIIAEAFVIVVIGGMGSIMGAFLAAVLISELNAFGILIFPQITLVLMFLVMAVILVVRPWGLLGKPEFAARGPGETPEAPYRPADARLKTLGWCALALLAAVPLAGDDFLMVLGVDVLLLALFATSLHFIMGPGGMVTFGHAAYFGLGAYGAALLVKFLGTPMEAAILGGIACAIVGAFVFGWFCVRLSGVYFAMLTLAFAQIGWSVVFQWGEVTGGDDGILNVWPSAWASSRLVFYFVTLVLCGCAILFMRHLLHAPFGYGLRAGRDSPLRAEAIGIDVNRRQWHGFVLAGSMAGLAGALYAFSKGSVFPDIMAIPQSIDGLMMVLLGGVKTLTGPYVGAAAFHLLEDQISRLEFWRAILGATILFLVIVFPQGLAGFVRERFARDEEAAA
jgi:branched-chain amino acid transport system permease protein